MLNGGLDLSILDVWWVEAFDGTNGFAIGMGETHSSIETHDRMVADALTRALVDGVIPLYYGRDRDGLPHAWIAHEVGDPVAGLAVQRRPDGDGRRHEMRHPRGGRHLE
jgi:glucan phosphorylase